MSTHKSSNANTLMKYFNKKIKTTHDGNNASTPSSSTSSSITAITPVTTENSQSDVADIGCCFNQKVSDELKYKLLSNVWTPDEKFTFPVSGNRNLKFQLSWIKRFPWLCYTNMEECGAVCKYCAIFYHNFIGKGAHQKPGVLVTKPFNKWKNALEIFNTHNNTEYHKNNVFFAENFISVFCNQQLDICQKIDSARANQIVENRKKLIPVIQTIILCGRQELALRGTSDSGPLTLNEPVHNDGNFRALLRMRMNCGDKMMTDCIENGTFKAMYLSPTIQNNLIDVIGKIIQDCLVNRINRAKSFSILVDETTDISRIEQMSFCIRYIDENPEHQIILREDFLKFVSVENTTGKNLANVILESINSLGINPKYMVGQGYDGAAAMSGNFKGVQALIREKYPAALYVHCSAHSLNLALSHSCDIQHIRNCIGTIKSVGNFIKGSALRTNVLKKYIKEQFPESKWTKLTSMCETRWVENHDGLIRFTEIYKAIVSTLEELQLTRDIETSSKALQLENTIITSDFVISMVSASVLFSLTLPLCKNLQSVNCDLTEAMEYVDTVLHEINDMRSNMDYTFSKIFIKAEALIKSVDDKSGIKIPRIVGYQKNRSNVVTSSPEEYYRITIAIPFFDDFIEQLQTRFNNHKSIISSLHKLLPKICNKFEIDLNDFKVYSEFLDLEVLPQEINLWKRKWADKLDEDRPNSAIEAYIKCNYDYFPNIFFLLKVLATLPVSTSTPERSFSTMKRLKNFLRNSLGQERLTGLALLSVHRHIKINPDDVIDRFAKEKKRLLNLVL